MAALLQFLDRLLLGFQQHPCAQPCPPGALLPRFHQFYWIGIKAVDETWPAFRWLDGTPGPNATGAYQHWGYYMPQNIIEPNNFFGREFCCGANSTEAWSSRWGWADFRCDRPSSFMCKQLREWLVVAACRPAEHLCAAKLLFPHPGTLCCLTHRCLLAMLPCSLQHLVL